MDKQRRNPGGRHDRAWQLIGYGGEERQRGKHDSQVTDLSESNLLLWHPMPYAAHTSEPGLQCGSVCVPCDGPFVMLCILFFLPHHKAKILYIMKQ